jgi:hypothetical protein
MPAPSSGARAFKGFPRIHRPAAPSRRARSNAGGLRALSYGNFDLSARQPQTQRACVQSARTPDRKKSGNAVVAGEGRYQTFRLDAGAIIAKATAYDNPLSDTKKMS